MGVIITAEPIHGRALLKAENGEWRIIKSSEFLPIFFMIPDKIAIRMESQLLDLPRVPAELILDPKSGSTAESDKCMEQMCDAFAYLAWHAIGMKGWMENYSGYAPQWIIVYESRRSRKLVKKNYLSNKRC